MSKVYISEFAGRELKDYLKDSGCEIIEIKETGCVSKAVAAHPDIYMCSIGKRIYFGDKSRLKAEYPGDVLYNAAVLGDYIVCSRYTDQDLIEKSDCIPVMVKQGYVKCNLAVIDDRHVITEDEGIAKILAGIPEISCLLISPHQVMLSGHPYGFIGGCCGRVGNEIIFNGDLSSHSDYTVIKEYIENCGCRLKFFSSYPLTDIGSIIEGE